MSKDERRFYVYAYLRSKDSEHGKKGSPYYIGKGSGSRAWSNSRRAFPRPQDSSRIVMLRTNLLENEAFEWESFYIKRYGRIDAGSGILRNLTDGGEGSSGYRASMETRKKISQATKGNQRWLGKKHTEESRAKISAANSGDKHPCWGKRLPQDRVNKLIQANLRYLCEFTDPDGEIYVTENVHDFSKQYNLDFSHLHKVLHGKRKHHKGWTGRILEVLK